MRTGHVLPVVEEAAAFVEDIVRRFAHTEICVCVLPGVLAVDDTEPLERICVIFSLGDRSIPRKARGEIAFERSKKGYGAV